MFGHDENNNPVCWPALASVVRVAGFAGTGKTAFVRSAAASIVMEDGLLITASDNHNYRPFQHEYMLDELFLAFGRQEKLGMVTAVIDVPWQLVPKLESKIANILQAQPFTGANFNLLTTFESNLIKTQASIVLEPGFQQATLTNLGKTTTFTPAFKFVHQR